MPPRGKVSIDHIIGWQPEEEAKLRELHGKNISFANMTRYMPGRSKNALIGKAHDLGLPNRGIRGGGGKRRSSYTDEQRAQGEEMFQDGASYAEIGTALGVTRDAAIKLAQRERWARKGLAPTRHGKNRDWSIAAKPRQQSAMGERKANLTVEDLSKDAYVPTVEGVTMVTAERAHCRFVCAPHETEGAILCGGPANYPKKPYCDRHGVKTYTPTAPITGYRYR